MSIVGIDLGTTNCCASIYKNKTLEIIPLSKNAPNAHTLASFVYFDKNNKLVGSLAEKRSTTRPLCGIFDSKRMLGLKYSDPFIQSCKSTWPFIVKQDAKDNCVIEVNQKDHPVIKQTPQEISGEILKEIKRIAEIAIGETVEDVVITVPAYFTDAQRRATQEAADLAQLNVKYLLNEPTAAALAYAYEKSHMDRTILVFDLGGGTFDVSLVTFENGTGTVLKKNGDNQLGGRDFDNRLVNLILKKSDFEENLLITNDFRRAIRRLRTIARDVKEDLSLAGKNQVEVDMDLFSDIDKTVTVTRQEFENLNMDLFRKTIDLVDKTIIEANIKKEAIDDIVLVGGSTRIPKIRKMLSDYFDGKELSRGINPDEAVAMGAALCGAILNGTYEDKNRIADITPYSLGVRLVSGGMSVVLPKGTEIPAKKVVPYHTVVDNQDRVKIVIYEGESAQCKDNRKIGKFEVTGLKKLRAGDVRVDVTFELDYNNVLTVKATENSNNKSNKCLCKMDYE